MKSQGKIISLTGHRNFTCGTYSSRVEIELDVDPADLEHYKDKNLDVTITQHRNRRSLDANAALWHCISVIADSIGTTSDEVHDLMLRRYGWFKRMGADDDAITSLRVVYDLVDVKGDIPGTSMKEVRCYPGSRFYNSKQFSVLLDGVIQEMREMGLGYAAPTSEDMKRMLADLEKNEAKQK